MRGPSLQRALRESLADGVAGGVFVGASAAVSYRSEHGWKSVQSAGGVLGDGLGRVGTDSIYDLASLTKPFVATAAWRAADAGALALDAAIGSDWAESVPSALAKLSWATLLGHRSGLQAWAALYETLPRALDAAAARQWYIDQIAQRLHEEQVGRALYSDLGFIVLGFALEHALGAPLHRLIDEHVTGPLGVAAEAFFGGVHEGVGWQARTAPTGDSAWRGRALQAEVHDDNCAALGSVTAHAGMFGTARAVARLGMVVVDAWRGRSPFLSQALVRHALAPSDGGTFRLGWDGRSEQSAAGRHFGENSFGHLGFTGTSIWCDPDRELVAVLLSNRVYPDLDNIEIRRFRPRFHELIADAFDR